MDVTESSSWWRVCLEGGFVVAMDLGPLALGTRSSPVHHILRNASPDEFVTEEFPRGTYSRMCQAMDNIEDCSPLWSGNHRAETPSRDVAEESDLPVAPRVILELEVAVAGSQRLRVPVCSLGGGKEAEVDPVIDRMDT